MTEESVAEDKSNEPEFVSGTARNAKAGAVLIGDDGRDLYVEGLQAWPANVLGKSVTLKGTVERKGIYPQVREGGLEEQGMVGVPLVLTLTEPLEDMG